jgi:acyl carrier protein
MTVDRAGVIAMLATYQGRPTDAGAETIDSLELVWLLHQVEQRHDVRLDLDDDELARMNTVDGAVAVLDAALRNGRA